MFSEKTFVEEKTLYIRRHVDACTTSQPRLACIPSFEEFRFSRLWKSTYSSHLNCTKNGTWYFGHNRQNGHTLNTRLGLVNVDAIVSIEFYVFSTYQSTGTGYRGRVNVSTAILTEILFYCVGLTQCDKTFQLELFGSIFAVAFLLSCRRGSHGNTHHDGNLGPGLP